MPHLVPLSNRACTPAQFILEVDLYRDLYERDAAGVWMADWKEVRVPPFALPLSRPSPSVFPPATFLIHPHTHIHHF